MTKFKNLVFDLGNVIIDIDYRIPIAEFQKLTPAGGKINFGEIVSYTTQNRLFDQLESGKVSLPEFRQSLRKYLKTDVSDLEIDCAWNSIFTDFPAAKIELLKDLKTKYNTYALSNINELHIVEIDRILNEKYRIRAFEELFHKAYYSNQMGYRKPEKEIYEMMIAKENFNVAETFFVDDKLENVEAAKALGLQAYQLKERDKLHELLVELQII